MQKSGKNFCFRYLEKPPGLRLFQVNSSTPEPRHEWIVYVTYIFSQGETAAKIEAKLKREYLDVLITGWKLWPAVQMVNFFLVPFNLRPLVVGVVALVWNTYMSWKCNS